MSRHSDANAITPDMDYRTVFLHAPISMAISQDRTIMDCNELLIDTFKGRREDLVGRSFKVLYPTPVDFEQTGQHTAAIFLKDGRYANDRIMRRLDGELFWCYMTGFAFYPQAPHALVIWSFVDLSQTKSVVSSMHVPLTARERDVCALLASGLTSKEIGKQLSISPRTVDTHRASLMHKYAVKTTSELLQKVLHGV